MDNVVETVDDVKENLNVIKRLNEGKKALVLVDASKIVY
jgi:prefoldin subunit 5